MNNNQQVERLSYGTSGFRYNHKILLRHGERIGRAIALLCVRRMLERIEQNSCLACEVIPSSLESTPKVVKVVGTWGLMVTASHNPPEDNGVKLVDSEGKMVRDDEERFLVRVVNKNSDLSDVLSEFQELSGLNRSDLQFNANHLQMVIARDTRGSGRQIASLLSDGMRQILRDIHIIDIGHCTTPELHIITTKYVNPRSEYFAYPSIIPPMNHFLSTLDIDLHTDMIFGPGPNTYYVRSIRSMIERYGVNLESNVVDCANGVGGLTLKNILKLRERSPLIINNDRPECLNSGCGSDYVETHTDVFFTNLIETDQFRDLWLQTREGRRYVMKGLTGQDSQPSSNIHSISDHLFCSFDGDADRIVFYYFDLSKSRYADLNDLRIRLMNGDHISALILRYVTKLLHHAPHLTSHPDFKNSDETVNIGVIYTPYSDGNFVRYIEEVSSKMTEKNDRIRIHKRCVPIGVKNLIRAAESYDIAIYYESNGHGSVIVNKEYGIPGLRALRQLFNQVIGDGIMNLIGVQYILQQMKMSPAKFFSIFTKCKSVMKKIEVNEDIRSQFKMDGIDLVEPKEVIKKLEDIESQYLNTRVYIRPSGTEPILRAYIETENSDRLNDVTKLVMNIIAEYGERHN
jgi:phosphoacetylglucosamine mutase